MYMKKPDVEDLIKSKDWPKLRAFATKWPVADVAELLGELGKPDRVVMYRSLPRVLAAEVFAYLESHEQDSFLRDLSDEEARSLMENLAPDDRTALLEELPARVTQRLLGLLGPADLVEARQLLGYPEESIGRLMTPDYVSAQPNWTVGRTMEEIREKGKDSETINAIYVTDPASRLVGSVALQQIVLGNPNDTIRGVMRAPAISMSAFEDRENAAKLMERYALAVLPVVDSEGALVGIVTGDDVLEVAQEETTEDFQKSAAVSPLRISIKDAKPMHLYKNRVGWLIFLAIMDLFAGKLIAGFSDTIAKVVALVSFLPLLIDSAGNSGSQSATLAIRAFAMGDITHSDWLKVLWREIRLSLALGGTMGAAVFAICSFTVGPSIGAIVGITMVIIVPTASIIGIALPFAFVRFGFDPAAASSPFVTSVADIAGVMIYFTMARLILGI